MSKAFSQLLIFVILVGIIVAGCEQPSLDRWKEIQLGMTTKDVIDIVGYPNHIYASSFLSSYTIFYYSNFKVEFENGLVVEVSDSTYPY